MPVSSNELQAAAHAGLEAQAAMIAAYCRSLAQFGAMSHTVLLPTDIPDLAMEHLRRQLPGCAFTTSASGHAVFISWRNPS